MMTTTDHYGDETETRKSRANDECLLTNSGSWRNMLVSGCRRYMYAVEN